ncbi:ParA family protein [Paenibacillus doosanensis]|uniref:ParA family protein n=1 Tax=Paenibacillus doosanensis TaxID=1229154 RepID=UPI00217FFA09|nr:ParA family protein [Paenibacillus doosanensis]MCS7460379.1 ParA family protein [Paenibacillus doosanensis]
MNSNVITILSTKGGVGKSTLARFLSIVAAENEKKVCIIDTCQNSSIATGFLQHRDSFEKNAFDWLTGEAKPSEVIQRFEESNIYYIPSDERIDDFGEWVSKKIPRVKQLQYFNEKIEPLQSLFDFIIIDSHPSENSDIVNYSIAASDYCLIPSEVDLDSKLAVLRCVEIIREYQNAGYNLDYGIIFNKVELNKAKAKNQKRSIQDELCSSGIPEEKFIGDIRYSSTVSACKNEGILLHNVENKYAKNIMNDFRKVGLELFRKLGGDA